MLRVLLRLLLRMPRSVLVKLSSRTASVSMLAPRLGLNGLASGLGEPECLYVCMYVEREREREKKSICWSIRMNKTKLEVP